MGTNSQYQGPRSLPALVPIFPLTGALLLPRGDLPLNVFEPRYLAMVDHALAGQRLIGMVQPADMDSTNDRVGDLNTIGCVGRITGFMETDDGRYLVTLTGISRVRIVEEMAVTTPFRQCRIDASPFAQDFTVDNGGGDFDRDPLITALKTYLDANNLAVNWDEINRTENEALVNLLSMAAPYGWREKQALLEADGTISRAAMLIAITERELGTTIGDADIHLQ